MQDKIQKGKLYQHYKGRFYRVLDVAIHTETEEELVIYTGINKKTNQASLFARPLNMWLEEVNGKPRFEAVEDNCPEALKFFKEMNINL